MKRTLPASMLGVVISLMAVGTAAAQGPVYGPTAPGPDCYAAPVRPYAAGCHQHGCGGFCFRFLGSIHQHGPLFNYGPYYGYYPFEPYGPWNAQLQYTGPRPSDVVGCGWNSLFGGKCGKCGGHHGRGGCALDGDGWGSYANSTFRNIFDRTHPRCHKAKCGTCGDL